MGTNRHTLSNTLMLGATVMLTSTIACAAQPTAQTAGTQGAAIVTAQTMLT